MLASGRFQGRPYLVMEFVEGMNAAELIRRVGIGGMLNWQRVLNCVESVAQALLFLGEESIVHRNIAPTTILISKDESTIKLGNPILAKTINSNTGPQVTQAGDIVGQLAYRAPEQVSGTDASDVRSDIYNLGAVAYALLTGRPPHDTLSVPDLISCILTKKPEPPSNFHLGISALFESTVLKMLEKRAEHRFQSAAELLKDLERVRRYTAE